MVDMLKGEKAIITGSAQGIGKSIALKFASEGADIMIVDLDVDKAAETKKEINDKYPNVKVAVVAGKDVGDIVKMANCEKMAEVAKNELGGCTVLINNAGLTLDKPIHTLSEQWWDIILNVILVGSFNMTKAIAPLMQEGGYGKIWNVSSVAGIGGNAAQINYSSAKSGLVGLTKACARELAKDGIAVNVVGFGAIWTRLIQPHDDIEIMGQKMGQMKAMSGQSKDAAMGLYKAGIPMCKGRDTPLLPDDVGNWFAALCTRDAHYMTGNWMVFSGGMII
ncbi:MAG: SDR family NAD(P)-dependent oxidoreductase [Candidatus Lokiarchaeota archaeon]|nr:SDR family NAD(P)-dependent oxidoreductase [Candidatus Lokiarchaeota archaeon]